MAATNRCRPARRLRPILERFARQPRAATNVEYPHRRFRIRHHALGERTQMLGRAVAELVHHGGIVITGIVVEQRLHRERRNPADALQFEQREIAVVARRLQIGRQRERAVEALHRLFQPAHRDKGCCRDCSS
jgi:hypothetical protein